VTKKAPVEDLKDEDDEEIVPYEQTQSSKNRPILILGLQYLLHPVQR
jgi:hypothetical protein